MGGSLGVQRLLRVVHCSIQAARAGRLCAAAAATYAASDHTPGQLAASAAAAASCSACSCCFRPSSLSTSAATSGLLLLKPCSSFSRLQAGNNRQRGGRDMGLGVTHKYSTTGAGAQAVLLLQPHVKVGVGGGRECARWGSQEGRRREGGAAVAPQSAACKPKTTPRKLAAGTTIADPLLHAMRQPAPAMAGTSV